MLALRFGYCCTTLLASVLLASCGSQSGAPQLPGNLPALGSNAGPAAAGSLLGLNRVHSGSIVYTPVNETIEGTGTLGLDLNNDKTNDFEFSQNLLEYFNNHDFSFCGFHLTLYLSPSKSGNGVANGATAGWAAALKAGRRINSKRTFYYSSSLLADVSSVSGFSQGCSSLGKWDHGYWWLARTKYLGLEFQIQGQTHYGWAQIVFHGSRDDDVFTTLTGYAYQTVAGKPIKAGQMK